MLIKRNQQREVEESSKMIHRREKERERESVHTKLELVTTMTFGMFPEEDNAPPHAHLAITIFSTTGRFRVQCKLVVKQCRASHLVQRHLP